mmetsp:Transcript_4882/g.8682  ORF Transcript_4882/g.8682 Transcript_4882/m.8682 type:complete len:350 (-) Transcript_4882:1290-2339(-)
MKIFAKRKKKSTSSSETTAKRTVHKSDPIVEELLKKDPSEWNAKERRMVKRYRERKAEESSGTNDPAEQTEKLVNKEEEASGAAMQAEKQDEDGTTDHGDEDNDSDNTNDDDGDDDDSSAADSEDGLESSNSSQSNRDASPSDSVGQKGSEQVAELAEAITEETANESTKQEVTTDDKVDKEHKVWKLLEQLNSKQKRTLTRKLDRLGRSVLAEVEKEAMQVLGTLEENSSGQESSKRTQEGGNKAEPEQVDDTAPKKKKRRKEVDWSSLPPEERLRREEQRRLQKEAEERRARGEDITPGHKHPLNSARRRANRRKPKWKKSTAGFKNEHNSSGYMFRKTGGEQQVMT